jgi:hypothetical protein
MAALSGSVYTAAIEAPLGNAYADRHATPGMPPIAHPEPPTVGVRPISHRGGGAFRIHATTIP